MADENQRINPKNSNLDILEYPVAFSVSSKCWTLLVLLKLMNFLFSFPQSFWQRKKKTIIAILVIGG